MVLRIAQLGQPVLRQAAAPVPNDVILTPNFQRFLREMESTLEAAQGAGLAAPQVFVGLRVFLARVGPGDGPAEVFINPRVAPTTTETPSNWEGCLSFPELLVRVPRAEAVRVDFLRSDGRQCFLDLVGFPARVVQHELDHLDGILTLDRAVSSRDIIKASEKDTIALPEVDPIPDSVDLGSSRDTKTM